MVPGHNYGPRLSLTCTCPTLRSLPSMSRSGLGHARAGYCSRSIPTRSETILGHSAILRHPAADHRDAPL